MINHSDLSDRSFRMTRGDGSVVALSVFLLPDGRIVGTRHPNESFWVTTGECLEFLDLQRAVTTRFTEISRDEAGWRLEGQYLPGSGPHAWHILEESPCPIDTRDFDRSPVGNSVAVMVRTHFIDDRVLELMYHLNQGRRSFDLYLTIDETNGRPETDLPNVVWHSAGGCPELGLTQTRDRLLWWCGDFPFYFALAQIPQYQYYAMIEYDVHLTQHNASLFNDLARVLTPDETGRVDAVGTRLRWENPRNDGLHIPAFNFFETTYSYFFPLIVLSKPAVSYLYAQRLIEALRSTPTEALIHCESLVPSHLIRAGFSCVDLNALLPGSYRNDLMILPGRQHGLPRSLADGFEGFARMIHPVYGDRAFLQRMLNDCRDDAQKQGLLRRLDDGEFELIPEPVRARFRARLTGSGLDMEPGMRNEVRIAFALGRDDGAGPYLLHGWAEQEDRFTWAVDAESALALPRPWAPFGGFLELSVVPFRAGDQLPAQRLAVTVDDIELGERRIDHPSHLAFYVPPHPWDGDTMRITLGHPDAARPVDLGISDEGRKLAFAVHAVRFVKLNQPLPDAECRRSVDWLDVASAADSRVAIATAEAGLGIPISAMLMGFTSLGDNCEFGIFQRQCATEPLGLLRFSTALLEPVIRGIDTGFEGLGEPGDIAPHVAMGAWAEWMIHEKRYGLAYHTEIREENATAEQVLAQETVKLAFLRRTFLEDLADGRKIYVCKRNDPPLTLDEVMPLFLALNRHADNRLLWVVPADDANPVGTVVEELPGLLRGHIDRFAPPEQVPTLSVPGWLAVCVNAWQLTGRRAWGAA